MPDYLRQSSRTYSRRVQYELALQFLAHMQEAGEDTRESGEWCFCACADCLHVVQAANFSTAYKMFEEFTAQYQKGQSKVPAPLREFFESMGFDIEAVEVPVPKSDSHHRMPKSAQEFRDQSEALLARIRERGNPTVVAQAEKLVEAVLSIAPMIECEDCGEIHP